MKFTSKDLMKAMGLAVGDRVKCIFMGVKDEGLGGQILELKKSCKGYISLIGEDKCQYPLSILLDRAIEILPRPKRIKDLKCETDIECYNCPLIAVCAMYTTFEGLSLYEVLEKNNTLTPDQEIYNLLKKRLDEEVEE